MKKKKRFFNNKNRNKKWTETETGRKISFADKYIDAGTGSDKFDSKRPKKRRKRLTREKLSGLLKAVLAVIFCFVFLSVGYCIMDLYIDRNAMPDEEETTNEEASYSQLNLKLKSISTQSISLDGGVMLDAVINTAQDGGYSSVTFDLKRDDGTIGYESKLATIGAYGAISSAASQLESSVSKLSSADILPVGRISCYKDNIVALSDLDSAVKSGKSVYKDSDGYSYLNPNSDTVYEYIKSIIEEANSVGISVFLLDNCDLPDEVSGSYDDGFEQLAKKLYADLGSEIKLVEAVDCEITDYSETTAADTADEETSDEYDSQYTEDDDSTAASEEETTYYDDGQESVEAQIEEKIGTDSNADKMYYITTNNSEEVKKILDNKKISNYIIVAQ